MAYSNEEIQSWVNGLGFGNFQFNGDFTGRDANGNVINDLLLKILGGQQAVGGITDQQLSEALGVNIGDVTGVKDYFTPDGLDYSDRIAAAGRGFITDYGIGDMDNVMDKYITNYDSDTGSWTTTERAGNQFGDDGSDTLAELLADQGMSLRDWRRQRGGGGGGSQQPVIGGNNGLPPAGYTLPTATPTVPGSATGGMPSNPYLGSIADSITQKLNENYERMLMPISDNAIAAGGLGGSRQGVAQGIAMEGTQDALSQALAGLYGGAYESDANRGLQKYGMDQSFYLGDQGQQMNWDLQNQGLDISRMGLGSQLLNQSYQLPWYGFGQMGGLLGSAGAQNSTVNVGGQSGGGWQGGLGGLLSGAGLAGKMGWWS